MDDTMGQGDVGPSEQTKEIEAALGTGKGAQYDERAPFRREFDQGSLAGLARAEPAQGTDEWEVWAQLMTDQVDKLFADNRTLKIGIAALGFGVVLALGVGAMTSKGMASMMNAIKQLGENQVAIANAIGMTEQPTQTQPGPSADEVAQVMVPAQESVKLVDFDPGAVVGEPFDGPASEASAATQEQLKADKEAGIIGEFLAGGEPE